MRERRAGWLWLPLVLALLLLYLPLLAVAVQSVNASRLGAEWQAFTWKWYRLLFENRLIGEAAWNTLILASVSTGAATVLGTLLALGLDRIPWGERTRRVLDCLLHLPVITPDILFAAALVVAFAALRLLSPLFDPGLPAMILGHVTFQVAFVALVVRARLATLEVELYEAARDLYGRRFFVFRTVTLPLLLPAIAGGAMLAFTLSLDDFVISFFTTAPGSDTLPIYIYGSLRQGVRPEIHALSTLLVLLTALLVLGVEWISRPRDPAATPAS